MIFLEIESELCSSYLSLNILMKRFFARDSRCFQNTVESPYREPLFKGGVGGVPEDLGLNEVKFSQCPFECYFTEMIPTNNI